MSVSETLNMDYLDAQYTRWKSDPETVSPDWRLFFEGFDLAAGDHRAPPGDEPSGLQQARVQSLIYRYRDLGHLLACMDPLDVCPTEHPLLELEAVGLSPGDLNTSFFSRRFGNHSQQAKLGDIVKALKETYARSIGIEYMHLQDPAERRWLQDRMEPERNRPQLTATEKRRIFETIQGVTLFEHFLNRKYPGQTRFSLTGAESLMPLLDTLARETTLRGGREIILGMAHRGRLCVQAYFLGKTFEEIFSEFESCYDPQALVGAGDVKYHGGYLSQVETVDGQSLLLYLVNNPSHLEAVDPVVEGIVRARQDLAAGSQHNQVWPLLIHGDAAFAGQGVVAETLNMSQLEGYRTGGTVHVVINNQIGYTTLPTDARSTRYATDGAKMLMVPIFHVHGENPEAVVHSIRLAAAYRATFAKDVVVDLICYRRYGHNEGDEPYFTQPQMYDRIRQRPGLDELYGRQLMDAGHLSQSDIDQQTAAVNGQLEAAYDSVRGSACPFPAIQFFDQWDGYHGKYASTAASTGVKKARLKHLAERLNTVPPDFSAHPKIKSLVDRRLAAVTQGDHIDWSTAESLAFATLVTEGIPVRLSGQDCARGTFSQRHSVLVDIESGHTHTPLNHLSADQAPYQVVNSLLAEFSVLGFEYGYASARPDALIMWEAQFGDFVNNAQAVIDLYIASGESKWQRLNGLTLLLPHGYEGLGPEHSSARLERFLQLCAEDNLQVCVPTTPAQYFHLLRRQVKRRLRKPLVVMTPKSLLRHPRAVSKLTRMTTGRFQEVLTDAPGSSPARRLIFCSGKIFYDLDQRRRERDSGDTLIVRLEQLYPFPLKQLKKAMISFSAAADCHWVQEEPANMGAWCFVRPLLEDLLQRPLTYIGRPAAASTATGFPQIHKRQQAAIVDAAIGPPA